MQTKTLPAERREAAPQIQLRTGLQSGASIETCTQNVQYWKKDFKNWYNQSIKNGFRPPFPSPI